MPLGERIGFRNGTAGVEELCIEVPTSMRWDMELNELQWFRITHDSSRTRIRLRRIPSDAQPAMSGEHGPPIALITLDEAGAETVELVESFDEETSWDGEDRFVRRIPLGDEEFEAVITFDPEANYHVHGMARSIVDSLRIFRPFPDWGDRILERDHPGYKERLASGENPDGWLY